MQGGAPVACCRGTALANPASKSQCRYSTDRKTVNTEPSMLVKALLARNGTLIDYVISASVRSESRINQPMTTAL
jgi:hypothetical protein